MATKTKAVLVILVLYCTFSTLYIIHNQFEEPHVFNMVIGDRFNYDNKILTLSGISTSQAIFTYNDIVGIVYSQFSYGVYNDLRGHIIISPISNNEINIIQF